jgi:hypothetical protein
MAAIAGAVLMLTLLASAGPEAATQPQQAQAPAQPQLTQADVDQLPVSLDRIREQLAREPAFSLNLLRALDIPVFRIEQRSDLVFRPDPNYWKDDEVGSYVRPMVNSWHYDFMKMANPNAPIGYSPGSGTDVLPAIASVFTGIRHAAQERQRTQVRQQIREELRQINEERARAGLPPLEESTVMPADSTSSEQAPAKSHSPKATIKANAPRRPPE